MLQNVYNIQVWCLAHRSEDHSVWFQHLEVDRWQQHCRHLSLDIKLWGKFSQNRTINIWLNDGVCWQWKKLHVSAYSGYHQVLTTCLIKESYIIWLNRVVMLRSHHHFSAFVKLSLVGCLLGQ